LRYRKVPDEAISRLPVYLRGLLSLSRQKQKRLTSQMLSDFVGINAWQIRKDFSYFGGFGKRGVGYDIDNIIKKVNKILNLDVVHKVALVGVGNLGSALLAYPWYEVYNLRITALFDNNPKKMGKKVHNLVIEDVCNLDSIKGRAIALGIIAVPLRAAQETADALVGAGVRGILNFSPCRISTPKKVKVINIDIAMDLVRLLYYLPRPRKAGRNEEELSSVTAG